MAKKSAIAKNKRRAELAKRQEPKRAALRAKIRDTSLSPEERFQAVLKLAELPRNGAKVRVRNRCEITGRPRANYRKFNVCRIVLRELASVGQIPGMIKSSW
jgi:small subunit ribosomal protein S14